MSDVWIKFCGCTCLADVEFARDAGADAFGMIFAQSPRQISVEAASEIARRLPPSIEPVAVFVNPAESLVEEVRAMFVNPRLQFSGDEPPGFVARYGDRAIKALHVDADAINLAQRAAYYPEALLLLDARHDGMAGGTGHTFPWEHAAPIARERPVVIAGGLTPVNVAECVQRVRPFGVDVRTGIESGDRKDLVKMREFVRAVREA
ncbi:MAG: phosphoribosylanthranilate isomerase [Candidatus Eremiobacteraeota bacterium]|nr:phosphoribosylanthranilate isomerase [Candidatus Eremiobacteraeota bacterium]